MILQLPGGQGGFEYVCRSGSWVTSACLTGSGDRIPVGSSQDRDSVRYECLRDGANRVRDLNLGGLN